MILRKNRLRTEKDFAVLFKQGKVFHSSGISLRIVKNKLNFIRVGFIISSKVSKSAAVRNKIRRRLRAIVGRRMDSLQRQGFDLALMARQDVAEMTFKELENSIAHLFDKSGLMPNGQKTHDG